MTPLELTSQEISSNGGQNDADAHVKVVGPTVGEQTTQALRNLATGFSRTDG